MNFETHQKREEDFRMGKERHSIISHTYFTHRGIILTRRISGFYLQVGRLLPRERKEEGIRRKKRHNNKMMNTQRKEDEEKSER